ncbi:hypothetical protein B0H13DRAFT_2309040 [Mycena leptocephala]|nr:hypothetical protein B0H13DRAFT_2309040 [Mycena leptocephala]
MSSSTAVNQLVSFLTRPLMRSHPRHDTSYLLSAKCPPPPAIQRACLVSGMQWAEWIRLLSSGVDLQIFIIESSLAVNQSSPPIRSSDIFPTGTPFGARLRATLVSARARGGASCALNPTRIPILLSYSFDAEELASASDSDAGSDSDSDISDSRFSFTSASSDVRVLHISRIPYQDDVTQVMSGGVMFGVPGNHAPSSVRTEGPLVIASSIPRRPSRSDL